jgi:hypothetical protein
MRTFLCVLLILVATATGAAFYFGLCTLAAEREGKTYVLRLVVNPDVMVPKQTDESAPKDANEYGLEANGRIASVDAAKSEFVLTENFKNMTFHVSSDTMVVINGQPAKLADLNGGDEATVVYTRQGQQLNANVVRCTRKPATQ